MTLFDAIKPADVRTVGNLAIGAGITYGVYETFSGSKPAYLIPGLLVVGGALAHVAVMDQKSVTALGQGARGAEAATTTVCVAKDLGEARERESQVKNLPWIIGGAVVGITALRLLLI